MSALLSSLVKALPTMQKWIETRIVIPTNNITKEMTISITIGCNYHSFRCNLVLAGEKKLRQGSNIIMIQFVCSSMTTRQYRSSKSHN